MNTYQRELLDKLINELTANASPNLHAAQMIAAELKGAMKASPKFTLDTLKIEGLTDADCIEPTPDADGWVVNTGVDPNCMIWGIKMFDNQGSQYEKPTSSDTFIWGKEAGITHYKPA